MANDYTLSPTGVIGTEFELKKKAFAINVIRAFLPELVAYRLIPSEDMMGAVSKEILRWWKMTAGRHIPHAELTGEALAKKPILIRYEDEETTAVSYLSKRDQLITHYDANGEMAMSAGIALAQLYEVHSMSAFIEAARTAAAAPFPGGQQVTETLATDIAGTYVNSIVGSEKLQANIKAAKLLMFEDNVPENAEYYVFMRKREHIVLQQDKTLVSRDYTLPTFSDLLTSKLLMVDNCWIIPTNNYPQSDLSGNTFPLKAGSVVLNGDYSDSVCVIVTRDACRKAEAEGVVPMFDWIPKNRHWQIGAAGMKGIDSFKVECAAEVRVA